MSDVEIVLRLIIASILGGVIGYERESVHKPAGFKTHIFVSLGSTLFTILAMTSFEDLYGITSVDPTRMIGSILTGMGFIGAGVIIHRSDHHVEGITTAAALWVTSGIGIAVGLGSYVAAITVVLVSLIVLLTSQHLKSRFEEE